MRSSNCERRGFGCGFWRRKQPLHFLEGKSKWVPAFRDIGHHLPSPEPSDIPSALCPQVTHREGATCLREGAKAMTLWEGTGCVQLTPSAETQLPGPPHCRDVKSPRGLLPSLAGGHLGGSCPCPSADRATTIPSAAPRDFSCSISQTRRVWSSRES